MFYENAFIQAVNFDKEENTFEVIYRERSQMTYASNPPQKAPDRVYKEKFGVDPEGKIYLIKRIEGTHVPAHTIPEQLKFDE